MKGEELVMKNLPICVDASFVVVLLVKSNSSVQSHWRKWLDEQRTIISPALMRFEVVNALHQYWRHNLLPADIIQDSIDVLYNLPVSVQNHSELHTRAVTLAQQLNLGARMTPIMWRLPSYLALSCGRWTLACSGASLKSPRWFTW